jgi:predicted ribosome quality control (RQC) complex YloA/Tae2 family protein
MSIPGSCHQQYPVIAALSRSLSGKLEHAKLEDAYTLSKEELVLVFLVNEEWYTIRIIQRYRTCMLLFDTQKPDKVSNAQSCFGEITGSVVLSTDQHPGNRSFTMRFPGDQQLVFKLYDALVNVILFRHEEVTDLFRKSIANDLELRLSHVAGGGNSPEREPAEHFYIYKRNGHHPYYFDIQEQEDELILETGDVTEALTLFSRLCLGYYHFYEQQQRIIARLTNEAGKCAGLIAQTQQGIENLVTRSTPEEIANIIMANLHAIPGQATSAALYDFYHDRTIDIKLKKELNAQQNAAYYYRKAKNSKQETNMLTKKLSDSKERLKKLQTDLAIVKQATSLKELKPYIPKEQQQQQQSAFRVFEHQGFSILVGKSAANNDELTMKHSHKNDLWLHAKDVAGSHVLIKWKPGQEFPREVIIKAARLAAYYSKLKGSALVPVSYTLKKFVRKRKGSEPGEVVVDKEEVMMVEPGIDV